MSTAQRQLSEFMAKYEPEIAKRANAAVAKMRKIIPEATQLVYDNYNALVIGFCASDRPSDVILSIALYPRWVTLFFVRGKELNDPQHLLKGSGKTVRGVVLDDAADLDKPAIRALIAQAVKLSERKITGPAQLIIQSISAKQRPRRPAAKRERTPGRASS